MGKIPLIYSRVAPELVIVDTEKNMTGHFNVTGEAAPLADTETLLLLFVGRFLHVCCYNDANGAWKTQIWKKALLIFKKSGWWFSEAPWNSSVSTTAHYE